MRHCLYILIALIISAPAFAQDASMGTTYSKNSKLNKHEIKLGVIKPIAYKAIEFTYEFVASNKFGFGLAILNNTDKTNDFKEDFTITPFARFYFQDPSKQLGNGLFLEGFGKYVSGRYKGLNESEIAYKTTAIGLGGGYKWLLKSGFIIEPVVGFSTALAPKDVAAPSGGLRADIALGYRL